MPKSKLWLPVASDDLPLGLQQALQLANNEKRRQWAVCKQSVVNIPESSHAEIARLKEQVRILRSQLEQRRQPMQPAQTVKATVKALVMGGQPIRCLKEQYPAYRKALLEVLREIEGEGWTVYANIARNEIRRLDRLHNYQEEVDEP